MASTDVSTSASGNVLKALTFRNTRGAFFFSVIVLLLLGALGGLLNYLEIESAPINYLACFVVLFMFVNALISVRESWIAMVGLTLVSFWIFMAVAAPILPLHPPNKTTDTFTNYVAASGSEFADAPAEVQKAASTLEQFKALADTMGGTLPPALQPQVDAAQALVDGYLADHVVEEKNTTFDVRHNGETYWLSVDNKGRDLLSRIVWGAQRVLFWATLATVVAYSVGMLFGVAAGYLGGWVDEGISFFANVMLAFPVMVLFILMVQLLGQSGATIILAVTFASAPGIMRIVRGLALDIRTRDYIAAAQTRGETPWYIMIVELLPNARGPLIVDACLRLGYTTIAIATLSFLGLGLPPPDPDWGGQMNEARQVATTYTYMLVYPAIALSSLILGFNLLADGLRDISLRD